MKRVIAGMFAGVLAVTATSGWAQTKTQVAAASDKYTLRIPRLQLLDALKEFSIQTALQIGFWPDTNTDEAIWVGPLNGTYTAEAALQELLAQSGLISRRLNDGAMVVMAASLVNAPRHGVGASDEVRQGKQDAVPNIKLENRPPAEEKKDESQGPGSAEHSPQSRADPIARVVVVGSRLLRQDGEGPAPVTVIDEQRITQLGATSIPDILRYTSQQPYNFTDHHLNTAAQYAQMRGIGVDTTLVLINGRRTVTSANSVTSNAFDLNSIPVAAIDRIEVLSDSASAIYGADAMGGVVNIILKEDIEQPVLALEYGAAEGGGEMRRASFSQSLSTERLQGTVLLDYYERDFLLGDERALWRDQDFTRYGGSDYRLNAANPGNVRSLSGGNLPGLPSSFATVPVGSGGGLTPADFLATAGQRNYTSGGRYGSILPEADRFSAALSGEIEVLSDVKAFLQFLYSNRRITSLHEPPAVENAYVPASNPFNPFEVDVLVDFLFTGLGPQQFMHDSEMIRGVGGLKGVWESGWEWELAVTASHEVDESEQLNALNRARVASVLIESDPTRALNPFVDGGGGSAELLASLVEADVRRHSSRGRHVSGFVRGSLFDLPAGPLRAVFGGEWRDEDMIHDDALQAVNAGRKAAAAFAEFSMPLVGGLSSSGSSPSVDGVMLTAAVRVDDYGDFGDTTNPQFGVVWRPTDDLLLRASYGTSFRPPSLFELYAPRLTIRGVPVRDQARNEVSNVNFLVGGNRELDPVVAESFTGGFVLTPSAMPDLRLVASYWRVQTDRRVTVLPFTLIMNNEAMFSERVVRDDPTPADMLAGRPGRLLQVDISRLNFGHLETSGIDVEATYALDTAWGEFSQQVAATWVEEFSAVNLPATPAVNRVGVASELGTIPRWRIIGTLGWKQGGLGLSATATWIPSYQDANEFGLTGRTIPDRTIVDLQGTVELSELLGDGWWQGLKVQAGMKNALNEVPEFSTIGFDWGFDVSQADLVRRFGYISLSKSF